MFSHFPWEFLFDPWVIYKYCVHFPNNWGFSRHLFLISSLVLLWLWNVFCMIACLLNSKFIMIGFMVQNVSFKCECSICNWKEMSIPLLLGKVLEVKTRWSRWRYLTPLLTLSCFSVYPEVLKSTSIISDLSVSPFSPKSFFLACVHALATVTNATNRAAWNSTGWSSPSLTEGQAPSLCPLIRVSPEEPRTQPRGSP